MRAIKSNKFTAKRGDTIIEVMFAFAIFSLIAIISVSMMNIGLAASERSLELVTARNELNAQAEALRFIHSSYISELSLPTCDPINRPGEKCQQFYEIWDSITRLARWVGDVESNPASKIDYPMEQCEKVYANNNVLLTSNNAFVINGRELHSLTNAGYNSSSALNKALIVARSTNTDVFVMPELNARIIYTENGTMSDNNSVSTMNTLTNYTTVSRVEGIWVYAVSGGGTSTNPAYYDFYIQTCWNGSGSPVATSLDTIIRLYNPEGV